MQKPSQLKNAQDYSIGEIVHEGDRVAGVLRSLSYHPHVSGWAYLLVENRHGEFTVYAARTDSRCGLSLTRCVPKEVMMTFASIILGVDSVPEAVPEAPRYDETQPPEPPSPKNPVTARKNPVTEDDQNPLKKAFEILLPTKADPELPTFDWVS